MNYTWVLSLPQAIRRCLYMHKLDYVFYIKCRKIWDIVTLYYVSYTFTPVWTVWDVTECFIMPGWAVNNSITELSNWNANESILTPKHSITISGLTLNFISPLWTIPESITRGLPWHTIVARTFEAIPTWKINATAEMSSPFAIQIWWRKVWIWISFLYRRVIWKCENKLPW